MFEWRASHLFGLALGLLQACRLGYETLDEVGNGSGIQGAGGSLDTSAESGTPSTSNADTGSSDTTGGDTNGQASTSGTTSDGPDASSTSAAGSTTNSGAGGSSSTSDTSAATATNESTGSSTTTDASTTSTSSTGGSTSSTGGSTSGTGGSTSGTGGSTSSTGGSTSSTSGSTSTTGGSCSITNGGVEACDGLDNDCNGAVDETNPCAADCFAAVYSGHGYMFCSTAIAWADAKAYCEASSMALARIDDAAENAWVQASAESDPLIAAVFAIFFGGNDIQSEGVWVWPDGEQFWAGGRNGSAVAGAYTNWAINEPNNQGAGGEDCAGMRSDGTWSDINCNSAPFVCETP